MASGLDALTDRPIGEWRLTPPQIHVAKNGFVLRTYDVANDQTIYTVAVDAAGVRAALVDWAENVCANIRSATERELGKI